MSRQLVLLRPATIPLRDALSLVANQWSTRLGIPVRVVEDGWSGLRIEKAPDAGNLCSHQEWTATRA